MDPNEAIEINYPNNNNNNLKKKIKIKNQKGRGRTGERVREERENDFYFYFLSFLSQIYGNRIVDFSRSRRQSWPTRRELRVGTKNLAFRQTPRGREFSYFSYFQPKGNVMA